MRRQHRHFTRVGRILAGDERVDPYDHDRNLVQPRELLMLERQLQELSRRPSAIAGFVQTTLVFEQHTVQFDKGQAQIQELLPG